VQFELNRFNSMLAALVASAISVAGCNSPAPEKPAVASKSQTEKASPPAAKRLAPERAETPESAAGVEKSKPGEAAQASKAEPDKLAAKNAPSMPAAVRPGTPQPQAAPAEVGQVDPLDLIMPPVLMTDREAKTCQVKVGDTLPDVRLPTLDGNEEMLKDLYGQRLTVVLFWKATQPYAVEELGDLQHLVADRFADKQVKVVGIDVQDQPEVVKEKLSAEKVAYPNLIDATGSAFAQVATSQMPRTYLVDAQGKILWFDVEYSRSTRRDLLRAIRATLAASE
jgi:peroxiredoxin